MLNKKHTVTRRALPRRIARFMIREAGGAKLRLMVEISRKISTATELDEVLDFIIAAAGEVIDYDAAGIFRFNEASRTVKCIAGRGYSAAGCVEALLENPIGIVGLVITTGESVIAAEVEDNPHYLNLREETHSQLTVPITSDGKVIGAFNLESDRFNKFSEKDLEWLSVLATQVAIAIDKARLHEDLLEKKRLDEELRIAREVQLSLLPTSAPKLEGLDIAGINVPSRNIGGDLRNNYAIQTIWAKVNNLLCEILQISQFVTAFYGVLDLTRRRFTYSNAGHHPALLLRPDGKWRQLSRGGTVLGAFEGAAYEEEFVDFVPGDLFVLYTDGLLEAENEAEQMFGLNRLKRVVRSKAHLPAAELCDAIYTELRGFTKGNRLDDDTTIVVAKVL